MDLNYITAMGVVDVCKLHFYCSFDICLFFMSEIMHFTIFPFIGREEQERTRTNIKIIKSLRVYSKAFITFLNLVSSFNICVNKHSEKRYLYSYLCIYLSIYIYIYICLFVYLSLCIYLLNLGLQVCRSRGPTTLSTVSGKINQPQITRVTDGRTRS